MAIFLQFARIRAEDQGNLIFVPSAEALTLRCWSSEQSVAP